MTRFEAQLVTPKEAVERLLRKGICSDQTQAETVVTDAVRANEADARCDRNEHDDEPPPADSFSWASIDFENGTICQHPPRQREPHRMWTPTDQPQCLPMYPLESEWPLLLRADKVIEYARKTMKEPTAAGKSPGPWRELAGFELAAIIYHRGFPPTQGELVRLIQDALAVQLPEPPVDRTVERWLAVVVPKLKERGNAYERGET